MKKILVLAALAIMMVGCTNKKEMKLYNPRPSFERISVDTVKAVYYQEGDVLIFDCIDAAEITEKAIFLESYNRQHIGGGEWDKRETVCIASGYDSLFVDFVDPQDEENYKKGGDYFKEPYSITMWFDSREVTIIVN